ncbi:hypothetical protein BT96DRAFT_768596, partial [Gymnopus androsaceus JB14]
PINTVYPAPAWSFAPPTNRQIYNVFRKMKSGKATRPGTFPNDLYKANNTILTPHLAPIYRVTFTQTIYPDDWATNETIIARKPGKSDYRIPGSHRPLVLSHGHARGLNGYVADEVTRNAEILGLIPARQFG